jgi:hypothetical protein
MLNVREAKAGENIDSISSYQPGGHAGREQVHRPYRYWFQLYQLKSQHPICIAGHEGSGIAKEHEIDGGSIWRGNTKESSASETRNRRWLDDEHHGVCLGSLPILSPNM